jgi:hypothetical protein
MNEDKKKTRNGEANERLSAIRFYAIICACAFSIALLTLGCSSIKQKVECPAQYTPGSATKGLLWLRDNQNTHGGWGKEANEPLLLGLVLLAYDSHGETPPSMRFGESTLQALKRACALHDKKRSHLILDVAIARYCVTIKIPWLERTLDDIVSDIVKRQNPKGKFNYEKDSILKLSNDNAFSQSLTLSTLLWAYEGGIFKDNQEKRKKVRAAIKNGAVYLIQKYYNKSLGGFKLTSENDDISALATAASSYALIRYGLIRTPEVRGSLKSIANYIDGEVINPTLDFPILSLRFITSDIYYSSVHAGGRREWSRWNKKYTKFLLSTQLENGAWNFMKDARLGFQFTDRDNTIYSTSIADLMLESYWLFTPEISTVYRNDIDE